MIKKNKDKEIGKLKIIFIKKVFNLFLKMLIIIL